jgi:hypothetical protein
LWQERKLLAAKLDLIQDGLKLLEDEIQVLRTLIAQGMCPVDENPGPVEQLADRHTVDRE